MIKSLWNNLFAGEAEEAAASGPTLDRERLKLLFEHFFIGRKVQYYPEYKREIVFPTIIVGYRINDKFIYSRDAAVTDAQGMPAGFAIAGEKALLPLAKVRRFQVLVPDTSDMERSLDIVSRASIGRTGQFRQGNAITLIADTGERGIPTVDTEVDQRVKMIDGPFKDERMILLEPVLATMAIEDQRRKDRVETAVPVALYVEVDKPPVHCVVGDFSDNSLRLRIANAGYTLPPMKPNDEVIMVLRLGDTATYQIKGVVFRGGDSACVIRMAQLYRDGEFSSFKTMDMLELKSGLLNYGIGSSSS